MRRLGLTLVLLVFPLGAGAQVPPQSLYYSVGETTTVTTMLCDTADQLESILQAQVEGGIAAGRTAYLTLLATPNARQEPSCQVDTFDLTLLEVASVVEDVPAVDGGLVTVYVLYVLADDTPYAIVSPIPVGIRDLDA